MAMTPVILCLNRAGEGLAHKLAKILDAPVHGREGRVDKADAFFPNALDHAAMLFAAGTPIVGICASGILIRGVAPLLADKTTEPPVVSVSDDGKTVVPLLGGHRGANRLATKIAKEIDAIAAVTTAGDTALGIALDEPPEGYMLANPDDAKRVMSDLLNGMGVTVTGDAPWLNTLPEGTDLTISCGIKPSQADLQFHPLQITLGVGCARDCDPQELHDLVHATLVEADLAPGAIHSVNTLDLKADEPAVLALATTLGKPLRLFNAAELDDETPRLKTPSDVVFAEVGCHGVSEAAALAQAGPEAELHVAKRKTANATCAVAFTPAPLTRLQGRSRGKLSIVSIGPGQHTWRTPEASRLIAEAEELVGYGLYIDLLGPLGTHKPRKDFPLGGEEDRCRYALERAADGRKVALICSGDAGIYAMGALVYELLDRTEKGVSGAARRVEVVSTPGVSALQGAAARAGAPLGHDFCAISLSDLLTPRDDIIKRLHAAAQGDFVIAFYNPVSKRRRTLLDEARSILLEHRPKDTPVMLASSLGRPEEHIRYRTLDTLQTDEVDMLTTVLIGSSNSKITHLGEGPRMFTPRGYARKIDGDLA